MGKNNMAEQDRNPRDATCLYDRQLKETLVVSLHPDHYYCTPGRKDKSSRRRSTLNSYTFNQYDTVPQDLALKENLTERRVLKNVLVLGVAFMFVYTAFVSLQALQSSLHYENGLGVISLSCIYASTVVSCLLAPWIVVRVTTKWTMVVAFILFTAYFAANFQPSKYMLIPASLILGLLTGPLWSSQATYVTTLSLAYAQKSSIDQDVVINKYMSLFCGFYQSSQIWGNIISAVVLSNNHTIELTKGRIDPNYTKQQCGAKDCLVNEWLSADTRSEFEFEPAGVIPTNTKYLLLSILLGCGLMGMVILISLLDRSLERKCETSAELDLSSKSLFLATLRILTDFKCLLLAPIVFFLGLQQAFVFGDFTKSYVSCTRGVHSIGPVLICFGAVSSTSSIVIGFISQHIKRFVCVGAGATFTAGLLIVLWLWKPHPTDVPNFYVVSGCLGLCDAIWQTQTYTLFGTLFMDRQEAAFASYRMFHSLGCAVAFGYSYFLCVETKVYILAISLLLGLVTYAIIEMKLHYQTQQLRDIVAL